MNDDDLGPAVRVDDDGTRSSNLSLQSREKVLVRGCEKFLPALA